MIIKNVILGIMEVMNKVGCILFYFSMCSLVIEVVL